MLHQYNCLLRHLARVRLCIYAARTALSIDFFACTGYKCPAVALGYFNNNRYEKTK